jgi:RHS repeat-associated protein
MTTVYDPAGNVLAQIDQLGHAASHGYDALNRRVTQTDADNNTTTYAYDAAGNQVSLTDADHNTTTMVYDALNRMVQEINPLGNSSTFAYDAAGLLTASTDADGHVRVINYDTLQRETGETWLSFDIAVNVQTFTYDAAGNQLTAADNSGAYTMAYDALNRQTSVQEPFGQSLTYSYDAAGNQTVVQDSQGGTTTSVYDALNRLTTREFGATGQTTLREDLTYTADDQIATETRYMDLNGTQLAGTSSFVYDADQRLTNLTQTYANGSVLASYVYNYDQASRLTSEVDNGGATIVYSYDPANQLTSAGSTAYSYDATGNRTNPNYMTGPDNQLLSDGTYSYTYDLQGNLLTKTAGNDITTYTYDTEDRLVGVVETVGGTLQMQATYTYDVFGNRIETQEYTAAAGQVTTEYVYDGSNAWAKLSGAGALQTRQLFLPGQDQMLVRVNGSGTAAWYLTDRQGSVRNLVSYDGSTVLDGIAYDAYGDVTGETNASQGDAYKYDGYVYDAAITLYYVRARYYDALTGTWTENDLLGFAGGDVNLSRYVGNSPLDHSDPTGLKWSITFDTPRDGKSAGNRGAFLWGVNFHLSDPASAGGVIIQHVTWTWKLWIYDDGVKRAVNPFYWDPDDPLITKAAKLGGANPSIDYWEAFPVPATKFGPPLRDAPGGFGLLATFAQFGVNVKAATANDWFGQLPPGLPIKEPGGRERKNRINTIFGHVTETGKLWYVDCLTEKTLRGKYKWKTGSAWPLPAGVVLAHPGGPKNNAKFMGIINNYRQFNLVGPPTVRTVTAIWRLQNRKEKRANTFPNTFLLIL